MNVYKITNNLNGKIYIGKDTTDDKNYYGNTSKKVSVENIIYCSVSDASKKLNINKASLRYRLKSNSFKDYFYI
jgi:sugar diacid utilization regulator